MNLTDGNAVEVPTENAVSHATHSVFSEFRRGSPSAVKEVQNRVQRIISFQGYRIPKPDQEELLQEVLVQIWQAVNKRTFDPERGFWGFVQVVAARRCIDWMRVSRVPVANFDAPRDTSVSPLTRLLDREKRETETEVIQQLSPGCRELIERRINDRMSYSEIAVFTNRSEQALRAQMYRCVKKAQEISKRTKK